MINFKLRLQNKATLVALISAVFLMLQQFGLNIPSNIQEGVNTFVVILVIWVSLQTQRLRVLEIANKHWATTNQNKTN